jgi:hypothetical protein
VGLGSTGVASAATTTSIFYLDVGGSASVGVQPTASNPHGEPTASGYANDLVASRPPRASRCSWSKRAVRVSPRRRCSTEATTATTAGHPVATDVAFLQSHHDETGIVTVDLGFNNVVKCMKIDHRRIGMSQSRIRHRALELPQILSTLEAAAGPNVHFVGVGHYDPFLESALHGSTGVAKATRSLEAMSTLNRTLSNVYQSFLRFRRLTWHGRSRTSIARRRRFPGVGIVATNVAETCALTWMCQPAPFGPNLHPNASGYEIIAAAIADKLPPTF